MVIVKDGYRAKRYRAVLAAANETLSASPTLLLPTTLVGPSTVLSGSASNVLSGMPNEGHLLWGSNSGLWWAFAYTSTQTLQSFSSPDLVTWTSRDSLSLAKAHNDKDVNLAVAYRNIGGVDVLHIANVYYDGASTSWTYQVRATLTGGATPHCTFGTESEVGTSNAVATTFGAAVGYDASGKITVAATPLGTNAGNEPMAAQSTNADSGSSWTSGWNSPATLDATVTNVESFVALDLGGGNVLAVWDNATTGSGFFTNLHYSVWNGSSWSAEATVFGADLATNDHVDSWCAVARTTSDVHLVRRTGTNGTNGTGYEHIRYNGSSWSAGDAIPGLTTVDHSNVFVASDGTSVWLFALSNAVNSAITDVYYCRWQSGSGWGGWTNLTNSTSAVTRNRLGGDKAPGANSGNTLGIYWTESTSPYNLVVAGLVIGSGTPLQLGSLSQPRRVLTRAQPTELQNLLDGLYGVVATNPEVGLSWPDQVRVRPRPQPTLPAQGSNLTLLTGSSAVPAYDWSTIIVPLRVIGSGSASATTILIPPAGTPIAPRDFANPRVPTRSLDLRTHLLSLEPLLLAGQDQLYGAPGEVASYDWRLPTARLARADAAVFLDLQGTLYAVAAAAPIVPLLWPNPATPRARTQPDLLGSGLLLLGQPGQVPTYDWTMQVVSVRVPLGLPTTSTALLAGPVATPIVPLWFDNPTRVRARQPGLFLGLASSLLAGQDRVYGAAGQVPAYDWQLPPRGAPRPFFFDEPLNLQGTLFVPPGLLPPGASAYPERIYLARRLRPDHIGPDLLAGTLRGQDRIHGAPGEVPTYDWQNPRGYPPTREIRTWLQALTAATAAGQGIVYGAPGEVPAYDWQLPLRPRWALMIDPVTDVAGMAAQQGALTIFGVIFVSPTVGYILASPAGGNILRSPLDDTRLQG